MSKASDNDLEVGSHFSIPADEIEEAASRSSGPGGQHVNKSNTRVTLRWNVRQSASLDERQRARLLARLGSRLTRDGDLIVHSDRTRSRARNRDHARARIVELLQQALTEYEVRRPTLPSRGSKLRTQKSKTIRGEVKRRRARVTKLDD